MHPASKSKPMLTGLGKSVLWTADEEKLRFGSNYLSRNTILLSKCLDQTYGKVPEEGMMRVQVP